MLFEITETQKLKDMTLANNAIGALRNVGHPICLDDFGADAATLEYLSRLEVDFLKFDGRYIKALDSHPRDKAVIKHITALCAELGVATIAEMIETEAVQTAWRELGIGYGQGWLSGKPTPDPAWQPPSGATAPLARRRGVVEQWG